MNLKCRNSKDRQTVIFWADFGIFWCLWEIFWVICLIRNEKWENSRDRQIYRCTQYYGLILVIMVDLVDFE